MLLNSPVESASMNLQLHQQAGETLQLLRSELLDARSEDGYWIGKLSPSALSTATAVSAMSAVLIGGGGTTTERQHWSTCVKAGMDYLRTQQNDDGGFGDTDRSYSNIATSYLAQAASALAGRAVGQSFQDEAVSRLQTYLDQAGGIDGLRKRYGTDKTFVIPILSNLAIAGLVPWKDVAPLPFEAAVFPQSMYRFLQMPVVSYAVPALVAIGQARHFLGPQVFWPVRKIRAASVGRTMKILRRMQPESGGYLEATPLTSFVVMSLAATDRADHEVVQDGMRFLVESMESDGSWPIDTNLATWVTSLSVHALSCDPEDDGSWCTASLVKWHLGCQHKSRHPFTGAEPGGWGWTDLSGAVPDSDDTPAAILASRQFIRHVDGNLKQQCAEAIDQAMQWLDKLQNRNGGWPTFCKGWGKLPFDRSSNDLTAHVIRAVVSDPTTDQNSLPASIKRGVQFLKRNQSPDGSWLPLWFGNQDMPDEINPVYGTSRVLVAGASGVLDSELVENGCGFLVKAQNADGGWGGGAGVARWLSNGSDQKSVTQRSSVEETALAIDALVAVCSYKRNLVANSGVHKGCDGSNQPANHVDSAFDPVGGGNNDYRQAIIRGVEFLIESVRQEQHRVAWPIGFYFAKLWYHEELYPLIFATTALGNFMRATRDPEIFAWLSDQQCSTTSDS